MPLTLRLSLTYLLVTLAGALLLGLGLVALVERYLAQERAGALAAQAEIYAALLGELAADEAALQAIVGSGLADDLLPPDTAARVFSSAGSLLAGDPALGPFPSRAALALLQPPFPLPASQVAGRGYAASPVPGPAGSIGVVELSRPDDEDAELLAALRELVLQAALAAGLVVGLLSLLLARSIARPITALTRRAETLTASFTQPTSGAGGPAPSPRRGDEIAQLAGSLDRLEAGLRAYAARIDELEQARARFYRSVSHELRTPLTAIRGALENLVDAAPPDQAATLASLEAEAERLSRLVDELLQPPAEGRMLLAERRPVELAGLADELGALLAGRARRAGVDLIVAAEPASVLGHRDRLKQAVLNLLDNALRHTPPGGQVVLRVTAGAGTARISVEDSGPGVPADQAERIWERGVGRSQGAGTTGLGLAIVREIVVAHGGRASLDQSYGPGARFVIELPRAGPDAPAER